MIQRPIPPPDSVGAALQAAERRLDRAGALRPRRHVELLLESVLGVDRAELYLNARQPLDARQRAAFETLLIRREAGEPVQYLVGWAPFYGRRFLIADGVFIPRFDTEALIEAALRRSASISAVRALDLCCGSGIIGLTLAAERPDATVTLADATPAALDCSQRNAVELGVADRAEIIRWDALTEPPNDWRGRFDLICANPPYIPVEEIGALAPDVQREPHEALSDGGDGLAFYRRWVETLPPLFRPGGALFVEIGDGAAAAVVEILAEAFDGLLVHRDLSGVERVVEGTVRN